MLIRGRFGGGARETLRDQGKGLMEEETAGMSGGQQE